jgi:hypothetical protein
MSALERSPAIERGDIFRYKRFGVTCERPVLEVRPEEGVAVLGGRRQRKVLLSALADPCRYQRTYPLRKALTDEAFWRKMDRDAYNRRADELADSCQYV